MAHFMEQRIIRNDFTNENDERTLLIECFSSVIELTPDNPRSEACACLEMREHGTDESILASLTPLEARALADALNLLADEYDAFNEGEDEE